MARSLHGHHSDLNLREVSVPPVRRSPFLEPSNGATCLGLLLALGIHASVYALAPRHAALAPAKTSDEVEVQIVVPPPPPELPEESEQVAAAVMAPEVKPRPALPVHRPRKVEAPPKAAEPPPVAAEPVPEPKSEPAPAPQVEPEAEKPSEPAPALVADADANSSHSIAHSAGGALTGRGIGGAGVPGGTGTSSTGDKNGVANGTGGAAQPVTLSLKNWRCPWPEEAEYEDFDQQLVAIRVLVATDGSVEKAEVVSDPGYGFGRAARDCARRVRFNPAKDAQGRAIKAQSPPIHVRFVR